MEISWITPNSFALPDGTRRTGLYPIGWVQILIYIVSSLHDSSSHANDRDLVELPPYIRYRTPNPTEPGEPSVAATSAPFQSEPDTPVGGQPPTGRSPESYGIQSPQNSDLSLSWEHQLAAMDSPDPAPANIGHYIGTSYSPEHPVSSVKASPTYCHSPWSYPTKPNLNTLATWDQTGHPEQTAWYPPSAFDPELAIQDSLAHDTSSTRSSMNYTTAETGPSYAASLVLDVQQDWLLHGADLDNNPSHASGLWGSGVDSNCTVEGGITPLHYVAYQRNAGMAGVPPREGGLSSWDHTSYRG